jgi:glycosyltransferase involved in cell wall biosynthesis
LHRSLGARLDLERVPEDKSGNPRAWTSAGGAGKIRGRCTAASPVRWRHFVRKGGPELLAAFAALPGRACELDIVTTAAHAVPAGVRIHQLQANSLKLRQLYRDADLFVLPTRAECLGIAAIEAMASAVPVLMTDVGGARDIVVDGETGWLLQSPQDLSKALDAALKDRERLKSMGLAARARAERVFDGAANDRQLVDLLLSLSRPRRGHDDRRRGVPPADRPSLAH